MSGNPYTALGTLLYLNAEGADVWFKFNNERIPSHKLFLTTQSDWFKTMFLGSLPEGDEVDMTKMNMIADADAFKEFLRYIYQGKVNLTMENIEGVIDLAKQSLNNGIFTECEDFLMKTITSETVCLAYQLALLYDANRLKAICEDEICVFAEQILRSKTFLNFQYEFLQNVLRCDALACEEIYVFQACIEWAKAECKRNDQDATKAENLRAHLKDSVYQIRFTSMTKEQVAVCIKSCPRLFSGDELQEIICMIAKDSEYEPKLFNWTQRYFNLQWDKGHHLDGRRKTNTDTNYVKIESMEIIESTKFSCNRYILLKGFTCECSENIKELVNVKIIEQRLNGTDTIERYNDNVTLEFEKKRCRERKYAKQNSYECSVQLNKSILLRPNYTYEIVVTFDEKVMTEEESIKIFKFSDYKWNMLLDHDILVMFTSGSGIISALSLSRFDDYKLKQKLINGSKIKFNRITGRYNFPGFWKYV